MCFFFFKQKTAYERRISDGSSDVCSSDLAWEAGEWECADLTALFANFGDNAVSLGNIGRAKGPFRWAARLAHYFNRNSRAGAMRNIRAHYDLGNDFYAQRSEEHTSELQSLMRISYAVFCLKKKKKTNNNRATTSIKPLTNK